MGGGVFDSREIVYWDVETLGGQGILALNSNWKKKMFNNKLKSTMWEEQEGQFCLFYIRIPLKEKDFVWRQKKKRAK